MDMNSSSAFQLVPEFFSSKFQAVIDFNALELDKTDYLGLLNYIHCGITKKRTLTHIVSLRLFSTLKRSLNPN